MTKRTKRAKRREEYRYIWKLNAIRLPNGLPLHCTHDHKVVYATHEAASKAADEFERIDGMRMMPYMCKSTGPQHFHVARRLNGSQKAKNRRIKDKQISAVAQPVRTTADG